MNYLNNGIIKWCTIEVVSVASNRGVCCAVEKKAATKSLGGAEPVISNATPTFHSRAVIFSTEFHGIRFMVHRMFACEAVLALVLFTCTYLQATSSL